jgi:hypothetical protein
VDRPEIRAFRQNSSPTTVVRSLPFRTSTHGRIDVWYGLWTHGNSSPRGAPSGSTAHRHPQFEQRTELLTETAPQPCAHRRVTTICAQCASPSRETSALPSSVPSSTPRVAPTSRPTSGPDIWSPFAWLRLLSLSLCPMAHQAWHQDDTSECCAQHETKCSPIVTLTLTPTAERQGSSPRGAAPS